MKLTLCTRDVTDASAVFHFCATAGTGKICTGDAGAPLMYRRKYDNS